MQTIAVYIIIAIAVVYCILKAAKALRSKDPCAGCAHKCTRSQGQDSTPRHCANGCCSCDSEAEKDGKE